MTMKMTFITPLDNILDVIGVNSFDQELFDIESFCDAVLSAHNKFLNMKSKMPVRFRLYMQHTNCGLLLYRRFRKKLRFFDTAQFNKLLGQIEK